MTNKKKTIKKKPVANYPKNYLPLLREARRVLSDQIRFTTGAFARDSGNLPTCTSKFDAESFCVRGAIMYANDGSEPVDLRRFMDEVSMKYYNNLPVSHVNDIYGYESALELLDLIIEEAKHFS
jgi:hypothetical protein